ncbi:MAG TPA: hypothetical protein VE152_05160 [Acidimicrobiales bacterium]|nr:hypothetical protein [Acidimicrobiales bacterium]
MTERARADRVAAGEVEEGGVPLHNGAGAGTGDEVTTGANRADLHLEEARRGEHVATASW